MIQHTTLITIGKIKKGFDFKNSDEIIVLSEVHLILITKFVETVCTFVSYYLLILTYGVSVSR